MKTRDASIELFRCLMMLGVVFIHSAYYSIGAFTWENSIGRWCVDGFVMISGYYGIKAFSLRKVLRLYITTVFLMFAVDMVSSLLCSGKMMMGGGGVLASLRSCWFLHAYVIVMALTPIINAAAAREDRLAILLPFCLLVFLWGTACELPYLNKSIWRTPGIGSSTGLTLAAVYAVGRLYRVYALDERIKSTCIVLALPILLGICCFGMHNSNGDWCQGWLGGYASPFSVAIAMLVFTVFRRIKIPDAFGKFIVFVSASMCPVYIIHGRPAGQEWLRSFVFAHVDLYPVPVVLVVASLIWFVTALLCDMPRRLMVWVLDAVVRRFPVRAVRVA